MKNKATYARFEDYLKKHDLKAVKRFDYKGVDVLIAEGGPFYYEYPRNDDERQSKNDFPTGFYETAYAIGLDDDIKFFQPILFDRFHDIQNYSEPARRQLRINSAIKTAKNVIDGNETYFVNFKKDSQNVKKVIQT